MHLRICRRAWPVWVWIRIAIPLLAAGALCIGAAEPVSVDKTCAQLGYERIDLQSSGENRLFLSGKLNGRRRSVLLDTGWSFTSVSTNAARALQTRGASVLEWQDELFGTNEQGSAVLMEELKLGRVEFTQQPARAENMVFNGQPAPFDIVLGGDFLARHFAIVDCRKRRLYVRRAAPSGQPARELEAALRQAGFVGVELKRRELLAMTCPARLNGAPVEMLVDTGAGWSSLDLAQTEKLGLKPLPTPRKITGVGTTGTRGLAVAGVKSFSIGEVAMKPVHFALMDLRDWGLGAADKPLSEVTGILGGSELLTGEAVIDCHRLKLWLKPAGGRK